jgi:tRNA threonylcarbamoyladenosine biosynthesis protein TsaB
MLILSIDSAGAGCAVCVWHDGIVLAGARETMQRGQDARLMPMIVDTVAAAGLQFTDLDRVAVTRGPGSFTGLRVGLSAAQGIALAANKPLFGIDRFSVYREMYGKAGTDLLVVIDSRRADLFCRFFPATAQASGDTHEAALMTQPQIDAFLVAHPGTATAGDIAMPDENVTAACAQLAAWAQKAQGEYEATPLYLRAPDVTLPAQGVFGAISR